MWWGSALLAAALSITATALLLRAAQELVTSAGPARYSTDEKPARNPGKKKKRKKPTD